MLLETFIGFLSNLIAWQNILFTVTAAFGALLFSVQAMGIFGDHSHDADHDLDADHDHALDAGHDVDHDHALDADHDHDLDADHDVDHDHHGPAHSGGGAISSALKMLGVGRLPISLLLPLALTAFGFAGLFASLAFGGIGKDAASFPESSIFPVLGLAFAGAFAAIQVSSRLFRKMFPDTVKTASDRYDLLGLVGTVKSGKVDGEFGQVRLKDNFGHELEVPCIALDDARTAKYGDEVVLVDWDAARNRFKVVPFSDANPDQAERLADGKRRARALRKGANIHV